MQPHDDIVRFIDNNFHQELSTVIKKGFTFLNEEFETTVLTALDSSSEVEPSTVKLLIMTRGAFLLEQSLKEYGIVLQGGNYARLTDCLVFLSAIESNEVPEEILESILENDDLEEGFVTAMYTYLNLNEHAWLLENLSEIKDEFGVWIHEKLVELSQLEVDETPDRKNVVKKIAALNKVEGGSIGEYVLKALDVEVGLSPLSYILCLDQPYLDAVLSSSMLPTHIASLVLLTDSKEEEEYESLVRQAIESLSDVNVVGNNFIHNGAGILTASLEILRGISDD